MNQKILERDVLKAITDYLISRKVLFIRQHLGPVFVANGTMRRNPLKGFPDIQGWFPDGRAFAIEVKAGKNKLSAEQEVWIDKLKKSNVLTIVAYCLEDVVKAFANVHFT
jgi:hypothetical protein